MAATPRKRALIDDFADHTVKRHCIVPENNAPPFDSGRLRFTLNTASHELNNTQAWCAAIEELRRVHPAVALDLAERAETLTRRAAVLAQRLRALGGAITAHDAWLPLEMWRHIMSFLPDRNVLLGVSRELTTLAMAEHRGVLRLSSARLYETHRGGRHEALPTWCRSTGVTLALRETVNQEEWRTVCSVVPTLLQHTEDAECRTLKLVGASSTFLWHYNSRLSVDGAYVTIEDGAYRVLTALVGRARKLTVRYGASPGAALSDELSIMRCSAEVLDLIRLDGHLASCILRAAEAGATSFEHVFLSISTLTFLNCALLARVTAVHVDTWRAALTMQTVERVLRNSAIHLYVHLCGYVPGAPEPNEFIASVEHAFVTENLSWHDIDQIRQRTTLVLHNSYIAPTEYLPSRTYAELQHEIGVQLPYTD